MQAWTPANLLKTPSHVFSSEYCEIFKNTWKRPLQQIRLVKKYFICVTWPLFPSWRQTFWVTRNRHMEIFYFFRVCITRDFFFRIKCWIGGYYRNNLFQLIAESSFQMILLCLRQGLLFRWVWAVQKKL